MSGNLFVSILVLVFGSLVTIIQVLGLAILGDIRSRVARLESQMMNKADK